MEDEKPMTEQESLDIITKMINKAKCDYRDTGISALLWGSVITFCSLATFLSWFVNIPYARYIWYLSFIAVIPQVIISIRDRKQKNIPPTAMMIWAAYGLLLALALYYSLSTPVFFAGGVPAANSIFLIVYGIPTFTTGYSRKFSPMLTGGIACWVFAVANMFTPPKYSMLYSAAAAQLAWFIPGLILRKRYLKATSGNV